MNLIIDDAIILKNHDAALIRETEHRVFVEVYQGFGRTMVETAKALIVKFGVSEQAAVQEVHEYWHPEQNAIDQIRE